MPRTAGNRMMTAGRGLALLLLLAGFLLPQQAEDAEGARVVILVDESDRNAIGSTAATTAELQAQLEPYSARLEVAVERFGSDEAASTMSDALDTALWQLEPGFRNSLVIVSTGFWHADSAAALQRANNAGVPVYWLRTGNDPVEPRITGIRAPSQARPGQRILVQVDMRLPESGNYTVELHTSRGSAGQQVSSERDEALFPVEVQTSGAMLLDAVLVDSDTGRTLNRTRAGASVNVISTPKLLVISNGYSPVGSSLDAGGWSVTQIRPGDFAGLTTPLNGFGALILDDVAASNMPDEAWTDIVNAVQRSALGLLVLGGPNSFGLGAYRDSILEQVLPVVSEPPDDETPASVMFLVDVSGSMGRQPGTGAALSIARDAVLHSAAALRPVDRVGLVVFDVEARQLLPAAERDDHQAAIRDQWPGQASGGTSIVPALELASAVLSREPTEQKLMLLVTDGILSDPDLEALRSQTLAGDADLVVMALSEGQSDMPLSRIELGDHATLLLVDDVLRLPVLMRTEVEASRPAVVSETTIPKEVSPTPMFDQPVDWPALDSHAVTRARAEATVWLEGNRGEPLVAAWTAGTGRVVALTGGLSTWANQWLEWRRWPELASGLISFVAVTSSAQTRYDIDRDESGHLSIVVDTGVVSESPAPLQAQLVPPTGPPTVLSLAPDAPGRYRGAAAVTQEGLFSLVWEQDGAAQRHDFVSSLGHQTARVQEPVAEELLADGLIQEWTADSAAELVIPLPLRSILVFLALLVFLATVTLERVPLSAFRVTMRLQSFRQTPFAT